MVLTVLFLAIDIKVQYLELTSEYSINEQKWCIETLYNMMMIYMTLTIFKASTIGLNTNSNEFVNKGLILFLLQLFFNIHLMKLYFEGYSLNEGIDDPVIDSNFLYYLKRFLMI